MANALELNYQTGRTVYCVRSYLTASSTEFYNTSTKAYETFDSSNWADYAIALTEVGVTGYYRATCPSDSLAYPATDIFYEQKGASAAITDASPIGLGDSQGVNVYSADNPKTTTPIEVAYQSGRTLYAVRSSMSSANPQFFNTSTKAYEDYNASNWANYAISISEVSTTGYYRGFPTAESLSINATDLIFEQVGGSPSVSADTPSIAQANSQGVELETVNGAVNTLNAIYTSTGINMATVIDVCNAALTHLGQASITALSDDNENARRLNLIFNNCRDEVLRACDWNFATVLVALSELTSESIVGWVHVYTMPSDSVYVRKVYADDSNYFDLPIFATPDSIVLPLTNPRTVPFRLVYDTSLKTNVIVSNLSPAYCEYTARIADPSLWDSLFKKALSFKLASELSQIANGVDDVTLIKKYGLVISEAQKCNGTEGPIQNREQSNFLDARA